jgi:hypothetical protein
MGLQLFALNAVAAVLGQVSHQKEFSAPPEQQVLATVPTPEVVPMA